MSDRVELMKLSERDREGIKLSSNYRHFRDDLMVFDYKRFRGLGEEYTASFIANAVRACDEHKIYHYDGVLHVMKAMCFLGSHMLDDPRLDRISSTLKQSTTYGDTRIKDFCAETQDFLVTLAGPKLEHYRLILARLIDADDQQMASRKAAEHILSSLPNHVQIIVNEWRPHLIKTSQSASIELGVDAEEFHIFALIAAAMLGHGFYRDPLYPWVRHLTKKDEHSIYDIRINYLRFFAVKRIRKQLTSLEKYYGV